MRLVCPNCQAQYEVDARLVPETGRDVQCSNCDHTWFHRAQIAQDDSAAPIIATPATAAAPAEPTQPASEPELPNSAQSSAQNSAQNSAATAAANVAAPQSTTSFQNPAGTQKDSFTAQLDQILKSPASSTPDASPTPPPAPAPQPRKIDASVLDILQEEANRELAARAQETTQAPPAKDVPTPSPQTPDQTPEQTPSQAPDQAPETARNTVSDMAADRAPNTTESLHQQSPETLEEKSAPNDIEHHVPDHVADHAPDHVAHHPQAAETGAPKVDTPSRPATQPDNSHVEQTDTANPETATHATSLNGFIRGFCYGIILLSAASALYIFAPMLSEKIPALRPALDQYVIHIDQARVVFDTLYDSAVQKVLSLLETVKQGS